MQFSGFIETLSTASSAEEAFALLCQTVAPLGWQSAAFFALTPEARRLLRFSDETVSPLLFSNYPEDYIAKYVEHRYFEVDPMLLMAKESIVPIVLKDVEHQAIKSDKQNDMANNRDRSGIYGEISCPIHNNINEIFTICYARHAPGEDSRLHIGTMQVLSMHFYYALRQLIHPAPTSSGLSEQPAGTIAAPCLTQRERECLLWTARGKSASMISVILGLSENTINFYVKNAMKKLGTTNRVIAVVLAVRSGLIQP